MQNWTISKRPTKLSELWGLEGLKTYLSDNKFPKALLFRGQFGSGKTTVAKIIASMLVCQNPGDHGDPCCECASCKAVINETWDRDVQMIDGGNSGKSDVQDRISEFVATGPFYDRNKVMIIEEIQELSDAARNSLLKYLEAPREKIYFILLSMELSKSSGFNSRTVPFNFNPAPVKDIMLYLKTMMESEGLWNDENIPKEFKIKGLATIAQTSSGSYRQALQTLEQALKGKFYTPESIRDNMGLVDDEEAVEVLLQLMDLDVEVFTKIYKNKNLFQFFGIAIRILGDAKVYKTLDFLPYEDNTPFAENTKRVAGHKNLNALVKTFMDLEPLSKPYLRDAEFILHLVKFFEDNQGPSGVTRIQEPVVRTRAVKQ